MKTTATILVVLVALIGMVAPVLGAEAGSQAGAYADWGIAQQYTFAWAQDDDFTAYPDAYADAETIGSAEGITGSESSAAASESAEEAAAETSGESSGETASSVSDTYAESWDDDGVTDTGAGSYAIGSYVQVGSGAEAYWGDLVVDPIYSNSWAGGYAEDGTASSGGYSHAVET